MHRVYWVVLSWPAMLRCDGRARLAKSCELGLRRWRQSGGGLHHRKSRPAIAARGRRGGGVFLALSLPPDLSFADGRDAGVVREARPFGTVSLSVVPPERRETHRRRPSLRFLVELRFLPFFSRPLWRAAEKIRCRTFPAFEQKDDAGIAHSTGGTAPARALARREKSGRLCGQAAQSPGATRSLYSRAPTLRRRPCSPGYRANACLGRGSRPRRRPMARISVGRPRDRRAR